MDKKKLIWIWNRIVPPKTEFEFSTPEYNILFETWNFDNVQFDYKTSFMN